MSSSFGALLLTVSLTTGAVEPVRVTPPRPIIEAGLKKAGCTLPLREARVVGSEMLADGLRIVEVSCWRTTTNTGSILFAVPPERPESAQLLTVDHWQDGKVKPSYSIASPGFDAKTRTLSSTVKTRSDGDCGVIQEMKWTGWHFRLINVWSKDRCDGELFEWDSRERWQVFPEGGAGIEPDRLTDGPTHARR
jgi:hypothetical protein